ncbi:MAG TPA: alpha/beta hydrolase [Chryseolinea sp.]|nr:alpha/beta hydrolase [Chryseolinea sp.]
MTERKYLSCLVIFIIGCIGILNANAQVNNTSTSIPLDTTYTVWSTKKKLIRDYPYIKPVEPSSSNAIIQKENVVYLTLKDTPFGERDLHVDIFIPNKKKKYYPALVLVHGGGWRAGNKTLNTPMAQKLAENGFVVVSVEYRLSLEAKYPAAVHDIKAAIRWMREHASEYQIDTKHIAIGGSSAGGQLASLIGSTNRNSKFEGVLGNLNFSSEAQAVVDMDGLLDFTDEANLAVKRDEKSADVFWLEGFYADNVEKWKQASALYWVNKESPPFLFINSSQTRFHAGCQPMVDKLNEFEIYNEVHKLEGSPHSFWLFHPWFDPTVGYITDFLGKVFADSVSKK